MDASEMIVLKNGEEIPSVSVVPTMLQLRALEKKKPIALFELREFCLNRDHNFFPGSAEQLAEERLLTPLEGGGYTVHDIIRAVVLSAVEGEGLDFHVTSPFPEKIGGEVNLQKREILKALMIFALAWIGLLLGVVLFSLGSVMLISEFKAEKVLQESAWISFPISIFFIVVGYSLINLVYYKGYKRFRRAIKSAS